MNIDEIANEIRNSGMPVVKEVETSEREGSRVVQLTFKLYYDENLTGVLFGFPNTALNVIEFLIPRLYSFGSEMPPQLLMACWLDAQHEVPFGHYRWHPEDGGVSIYGTLPLPAAGETLPKGCIIRAVRSLIHLLFLGHLNQTRQVDMRHAILSRVITEEQADGILKERLANIQSLLHLSEGENETNADDDDPSV